MKSFNSNLAMTLTELIIATAISGVIFLIVFTFVATSIEDMLDSSSRTQIIDDNFVFKDILNRYILAGYSDMNVFTGSTNDILYLKNNTGDKGVIFGVVNIDSMLIQPDYIYGNNFIGYSDLSTVQILDVDTNSGAVYTITFHPDKLFSNMRIKDFRTDLYNNGSILDVYMSVINRRDENNFGASFNDISVNPLDLQEFNLNF